MLIEEEKQTQLNLFASSLPAKPYCSDDLDFGLLIRQAKTAIKKRYIQHNKPTTQKWLVFDCDYANALEIADEQHLPCPNIAVINRKNGNSHLLYSLEVGVHKTEVARVKPLLYAAKIQYALKIALKADLGYVDLVCKNPFNAHWLTYPARKNSYDLAELADYLTLPDKLPKRAYEQGLGKNCQLFENLRRWAYREVLKYRLTSNFEAFKDTVFCQGIAFNQFPKPLSIAEVKATAKSIAKWTWQHYTGRVSDEEFSLVQAGRGKLGGLAKGQANEENRATARLMASKGMKQQAIADELKVSQMTISRWLKA